MQRIHDLGGTWHFIMGFICRSACTLIGGMQVEMHMLILAYVFQCFWASRRSRPTPVQRDGPEHGKVPILFVVFWGLSGVGREPLEGGLQYLHC